MPRPAGKRQARACPGWVGGCGDQDAGGPSALVLLPCGKTQLRVGGAASPGRGAPANGARRSKGTAGCEAMVGAAVAARSAPPGLLRAREAIL